MIWQWASRICPHVLILAFLFEQTKLSLCLPVFYIESICATGYDLRQFNARRHMSLLIGNMKAAASVYPVGRKAGQVFKSSRGNLVWSLLLFSHGNNIRLWSKNSTGFFIRDKEKTVSWSFLLMVLWKNTHIIARPYF